uniref:Cytochrome P450 n=1 Tax=Amphora coffeiformis TaxID=265554 RepID=A0A7S3PBE1_9STRA|eukprot:scaffold4223_cov189-Amphora_coffeaeformis.AAC.6
MRETLRFNPVGPISLREAVHVDSQFPGTSIPAGTAVLIHLAAMNMRTGLWSDPHTFQPHRFAFNGAKNTNDTANLFFPFGDGPKGCIGMHLGKREVAAIVETVVCHYHLSIHEGTLTSLETHWDNANQPDRPALIRLSPIHDASHGGSLS